ncbi:MAG: MerR family transcriptional regulator [Pseudomonadota bacterium]
MPLNSDKPITRGYIAKLTGCSSETIRYYEQIGLLAEPNRGENGYRYYYDTHVSHLKFIDRAKQLGFDNKEIHELLNIADGPENHTRAEVKALTEAHINTIRQRILTLQKMESTLSAVWEQCDGSDGDAEHCPIILSLLSDSDETCE